MNRRFALALLIAVLLDLADFVGGWMPGAGDVLDFVGLIVLLPLIGAPALLGLLEFVPLADFLPFWTVAVILSRTLKKGDNKHG